MINVPAETHSDLGRKSFIVECAHTSSRIDLCSVHTSAEFVFDSNSSGPLTYSLRNRLGHHSSALGHGDGRPGFQIQGNSCLDFFSQSSPESGVQGSVRRDKSGSSDPALVQAGVFCEEGGGCFGGEGRAWRTETSHGLSLPRGFQTEGETRSDGLEDRAYYYSLEGLGGEVWVHSFEVEGGGRELDIMFELEYTARLTCRSLLLKISSTVRIPVSLSW